MGEESFEMIAIAYFLCNYISGPGDLSLLCFNGLVQERHNSIANALELHLYCANPLVCTVVSLNTAY